LVIAGAQDRLRSLDEARELHDGIPGSDFLVIEGTGHMIPLEAPKRLAELIAGWLAPKGFGAPHS
jgi:pimeloyl-ACP methyl ester carboxylesterase